MFSVLFQQIVIAFTSFLVPIMFSTLRKLKAGTASPVSPLTFLKYLRSRHVWLNFWGVIFRKIVR